MLPRQVRIGASVGFFAVATCPRRVGAQELLLQIRPRAGDTLRMRLDQETELRQRRHGASGAGPAR